MEYVVIKYFTDLKDNNHKYHAGDIFPRVGLSVTNERLEELSSTKNRRKIPLIQKIGTKEVKYTKTDIYKMPVAQLRSVAKSIGVKNVEGKSGTELKKIILSTIEF